MTLLAEPSEFAIWWTILQSILWLDMSAKTLEQVVSNTTDEMDEDTTLADIWDKLDFCAQVELTQEMETYDAECLES